VSKLTQIIPPQTGYPIGTCLDWRTRVQTTFACHNMWVRKCGCVSMVTKNGLAEKDVIRGRQMMGVKRQVEIDLNHSHHKCKGHYSNPRDCSRTME
jgi:hypothetical protein